MNDLQSMSPKQEKSLLERVERWLMPPGVASPQHLATCFRTHSWQEDLDFDILDLFFKILMLITYGSFMFWRVIEYQLSDVSWQVDMPKDCMTTLLLAKNDTSLERWKEWKFSSENRIVFFSSYQNVYTDFCYIVGYNDIYIHMIIHIYVYIYYYLVLYYIYYICWYHKSCMHRWKIAEPFAV